MNFSDYLPSSLANLPDCLMFFDSKSYAVPQSGWYRITAVGAGGSGAASSSGFAQGGCAGGLAQKKVKLTAGDTLVITLGLGGTSVSSVSGNAGAAGNAGGNTTVTGPGLSLTANGGPGGGFGNPVTAKTGGTASGGDFNRTGGGAPASAVAKGATGGGSIAFLLSTGYPAGACTVVESASGGAGVGGSSLVPSAPHYVSGGGGSFGTASGATLVTYGGPDYFGQYAASGASGAFDATPPLTFPIGGGGGGVGGSGGPGGGGGGAWSPGSTSSAAAGGLGAGGGGCYSSSATGGSGGAGGGGGGASSNASSTCNSGRGGNGFALVEFLGA